MAVDLPAGHPPPPPHVLRTAVGRAPISLVAAIAVTLAAELALAERKFAIFGGGFGQSRAVDSIGEIAVFLGALLACHALLFYLLFRLVRRLHGRWADTALFHFNFFFLATFAGVAVLLAKYQALSYFSDALSFQIVRNLGGGSFVEALLYSLNEASLVLSITAGAGAFYAGALVYLRRRWKGGGKSYGGAGLTAVQLGLAFGVTALLVFGAARIQDVRSALSRFNAYYLVAFAFNEATDADRDGYGLFSYPLDGHPFDGARHPFALDVPGNGVDEDGFAGDLPANADAAAARPPVRLAGEERPHVVMIVLESTRGDSIGRRIAGRPVAPNMEAIARGGTLAPHAYSHVGFTAESLRSLFTGRLAPNDPRGSLFEAFQDNGYQTGVFSGQAEDFGDIAGSTGMRRADVFVDSQVLRDERAFGFASLSSLKVDGRILLREFDRHFGQPEAWRRPNFLYFNFQSAHFPYHFPDMEQVLPGSPIPRSEISAANREWVEDTYWNAVAYNDRLIGDLVARLRRLGVWESTLLVVTGDHGESLFDDGFLGHGHMINRQQTHIPFLVSRPLPIEQPVGLSDMRDIILRAAGAEIAAAEPGPRRVFQYIGSLDRPSSIGWVDASGEWTIFSFDREALWTSDDPEWRSYAGLAAGSASREEADALISAWGRERWLHHVQR